MVNGPSRSGRPPLSLMGMALQYLARREYGREELRRKLLSLPVAGAVDVAGEEPDAREAEVDAVLERLEQRGLLSDARAAASVLRQKSPRWGQARLQQTLLAKGMDREAVQQALAPLQETELERARQVWQGKFGSPASAPDDAETPAERAKRRARQMRFLLSRGFSTDVAHRVVQHPSGDDD